jgi:hypothetical protein
MDGQCDRGPGPRPVARRFGLTLGRTSTTALVNISSATTAGALRPVAGAQQQSVPAGQPVYWAARHRALRARYVKVDVTDNDGTLPSVGLFQSPLAVCAQFDPSALPCEAPDGASSSMSSG